MKAIATIAASALLMISFGAAVAAKDAKSTTASVHSPESIECSKQADSKGLHGKERKEFRAKCKKELKAKATTTSAPTPSPTPKSEAPPAPPKSQ
jgi:hypothetical protein